MLGWLSWAKWLLVVPWSSLTVALCILCISSIWMIACWLGLLPFFKSVLYWEMSFMTPVCKRITPEGWSSSKRQAAHSWEKNYYGIVQGLSSWSILCVICKLLQHLCLSRVSGNLYATLPSYMSLFLSGVLWIFLDWWSWVSLKKASNVIYRMLM